MASHRVELLGRQMCGDAILTCRFSRPEGYSFAAGQWLRLTIETEQGPDTRTLSHSSGPEDDALEVTTRLSPSAFKVALAALEPGGFAEITGPGGRLALPAEARRMCFLVGGVGITPIRSILRHADATGSAFEDALLVYGNRDESCVPFADEFARMERIGLRTVICYEHASETWSASSMISRSVPSDGSSSASVRVGSGRCLPSIVVFAGLTAVRTRFLTA